jgi:hypothetical protein
MPISPSRCPCKEWRKHGSYPYNASPYAKAKTEAGYRFYAPYDKIFSRCVPSCSLSAFRASRLPPNLGPWNAAAFRCRSLLIPAPAVLGQILDDRQRADFIVNFGNAVSPGIGRGCACPRSGSSAGPGLLARDLPGCGGRPVPALGASRSVAPRPRRTRCPPRPELAV